MEADNRGLLRRGNKTKWETFWEDVHGSLEDALSIRPSTGLSIKQFTIFKSENEQKSKELELYVLHEMVFINLLSLSVCVMAGRWRIKWKIIWWSFKVFLQVSTDLMFWIQFINCRQVLLLNVQKWSHFLYVCYDTCFQIGFFLFNS